MPTNTIILSNAPIASVLAGNDISKGSLYGQRIDPLLDQKIYATYFVIKKIYDLDPNYSGMTAACLYLWELMGKYGIQAQAYTGGGGSIAGITAGSAPLPYNFIVDASTSFMIDGESSKTISAFIGYNLLFVRGGVVQSTVNTESSYYSWNKTTGLFTCSPAMVTSELILLAAI